MEFITAEIPLNCRIFDTGDWHVGPHGCDRRAIKKIIAEVKADKSARMILKGDLIDAITTDDKRWCSHSQDVVPHWRSIDDHLDWLIGELKPIKGQIITSLLGNHELSLLKTTDLNRRLCKALDIPWGGYTCIVTFTNKSRKKYLLKGLFTHGRRAVNSNAKDPLQALANKQAKLKKNMETLSIYDCIYQSQGHAHALLAVYPTINREVILTSGAGGLRQHGKSSVKQNSKEISPESRFYGCSGSTLKTFAEPGNLSYAEFAQYGPVQIGCLEAVVRNGEMVDLLERKF